MEKELSECAAKRSAAAAELMARLREGSTETITNSLVDGLNTLRHLLFQRIHDDVEMQFGQDSMLLPVSVKESEQQAKREIDAYQIALSALAARDGSYFRDDIKWYVGWLLRLQMGQLEDETFWRRRVRQYMNASEDRQRLEFSRNLESVFPEASRAPLILYRLFPLSVRIVSAIAYGQRLDAVELRNRQAFWLPVITDCHACHGRPLDNGDACDVCGNPIWNYTWLNAAD